MERRRLLLALRRSGGGSEISPDYIFDFGDQSGDFIYGHDDSIIEAYDRVNNDDAIRVRVITVYGTFDFYDFIPDRRMAESDTYDVVVHGSRLPDYLEIYRDGGINLYMQ